MRNYRKSSVKRVLLRACMSRVDRTSLWRLYSCKFQYTTVSGVSRLQICGFSALAWSKDRNAQLHHTAAWIPVHPFPWISPCFWHSILAGFSRYLSSEELFVPENGYLANADAWTGQAGQGFKSTYTHGERERVRREMSQKLAISSTDDDLLSITIGWTLLQGLRTDIYKASSPCSKQPLKSINQ